MNLPDGEVGPNARAPSESERVGFQVVVDAPVRSYPTLWVEAFRVREHVRVARDAPVEGNGSPVSDHTRDIISAYQWFPNTVAPAGMQ